MRVAIKSNFSAIMDALINIVLPDIQSPFARLQLSFAIDMLNQLQQQVEYRSDVMKDDLDGARELLNIARASLKAHNVSISEEIRALIPSSENIPVSTGVEKNLEQIETAAARVIDLLYEKKEKINNFHEIENRLLDFSLQYVRRKAKLRAPTINLELLESG